LPDHSPVTSDPAASPFDQLGGHQFFETLARIFYSRVADDPVLRPMYPEDDLEEAARRLQLFLEQYWGGPGTYSQERGHPRLRLRHAQFPIGEKARDAWLAQMSFALDSAAAEHEVPVALRDGVWLYFQAAAGSLLNRFDEPGPG
jgi:hemoglobin